MPRRLTQNLKDVVDLIAATDADLQQEWLLYKNLVQLPGIKPSITARPKRMPMKTFRKAVYHLGVIADKHVADAGASEAICDELVPDIDDGRFGSGPGRDVVPARSVDTMPLSTDQQLLREFLSTCTTCYTYYSVPVVSGDTSTETNPKQ
jgi:hypothetical protein